MKIDSLTHEVVMTVTLSKKFMFRIWLAEKLIHLAAWILGAKYERKIEHEE